MIEWDDDQLAAAGIDRKQLESLVRRLTRCGKDMQALGLHLYGASGHGCLIHSSRPAHGDTGRADQGSVVATIYPGHFDGGDW